MRRGRACDAKKKYNRKMNNTKLNCWGTWFLANSSSGGNR